MTCRTEHLHYKFKYEEADYTLYRDAQNGQAEEHKKNNRFSPFEANSSYPSIVEYLIHLMDKAEATVDLTSVS